MFVEGQATRVQADLVLPSPHWCYTLTHDRSLFSFHESLDQRGNRATLTFRYRALAHMEAEGLYLRLHVPARDFESGEAVIGWLKTKLEPLVSNNPNLLRSFGASIQVRRETALQARLSSPSFILLQHKPAHAPAGYTFWILLHNGNLPQGTEGEFTLDLEFSGQPDTTPAALTLDTNDALYDFDGFGGNYCFQLDSPITQYTLQNLTSRWARLEMSLRDWPTPAPRIQQELQLMRRFQDQGIPYVATAWYLPPGLTNRIQHITSYLQYAKQTYGVEPTLFSFNEPDLGIHVLFSPEEHRALLRDLGDDLARHGLKTKLLLGDLSNPRGTTSYLEPALRDAEAMRYVGAVAFHSWGSSTPAQYNEWAALADRLNLPLLVTEMGTDAQSYHDRSYDSYAYGLEELRQYQQILLHARPRAILYWEFTADYALCRLTPDGVQPTGRFHLTKHFTDLTPPNAQALRTTSSHEQVLFTAFRNKDTYALHIANPAAARPATLTGLPESTWRRIETTQQQGFHELPGLAASSGALTLDLPARSLTTLLSN